jgi:hypothetical protein
LVACDPNISVRAGKTSCGFGENVFFAFYRDALAFDSQNAIQAYSPATGVEYAVACATDGARNVTCVAGDGGEVHFNLRAVDAYDDKQADAYAATHDIGPTAAGSEPGASYGATSPDSLPVAPSDPVPSDGGPTPANEIPNYDNGNGYPVQCADGMWSQSGGIQGACSHHGGVG